MDSTSDGYSIPNYLAHIAVDKLKIAIVFSEDIDRHATSRRCPQPSMSSGPFRLAAHGGSIGVESSNPSRVAQIEASMKS